MLAFPTRSGVTAAIEGSEVDPTTGTITWTASDRERVEGLQRLESDTEGGTAPPLLVPFIGKAIDAVRRGIAPGDHPNLPSIADVAPAHALVFRAYRASTPLEAPPPAGSERFATREGGRPRCWP